MQVGAISFADRVAHNVRSEEYKDAVLRRLQDAFGLNILARHWSRWDAKNGSSQLAVAPHWVALRSNGNPYYMLFFQYEGVNQLLFCDVKIQPGYKYPRIILAHGRFDDALFANGGTVLIGEMVRCEVGGWRFVVNDLLGAAGAPAAQTLPDRLRRVQDLLRDGHAPDPMDPCAFEIKRYFPCTAEGLQAALAYETTLPYTCRGLYAWPLAAGRTPLMHNFDDTLVKDVARKVKDQPDFVETVPSAPPSTTAAAAAAASPTPPAAPNKAAAVAAVATGVVVTKWLRKTETPDVYDVYTANSQTSARCGTAIVRTLAASRVLREAFKAVTVAAFIAYPCRQDAVTLRWEPVFA